MSARIALKPKPEPKKNYYFTTVNKSNIDFIHSGCALLDCVIGGGWPLGRISNIVGDKSSGKTLLAIEACTNFKQEYDSGRIYYLEAEAAFDKDYAQALGMPTNAIDFIDCENTIEALFEELERVIKDHKESKIPGLFVVDSLDALSDRAELERKIDEGSFGANKPKKLSELFRRLTAEIEHTDIHLMVISQIRDNIGVMFGSKHTRSGGKALDFYASQVLWLAEAKKLKKTIKGIERIIGVQVKANCKKNKVGLPYRECTFPILFGYGIDDTVAHLEFLTSAKATEKIADITGSDSALDAKKLAPVVRKIRSLDTATIRTIRQKLDKVVIETWQEIEKDFIPEHSKY